MKEYISFIDFTNMSDEEKYKLLNNKDYEIKRLNNIIEEKNTQIRKLEYIKENRDNLLEGKDKEIERLNNIINELKEWFKGYHKSYAGCKWYEEDYIEFIEHLENELKGEDKE